MRNHYKDRAKQRCDKNLFGIEPNQAIVLAEAGRDIILSKYGDEAPTYFALILARVNSLGLLAFVYEENITTIVRHRLKSRLVVKNPVSGIHEDVKLYSMENFLREKTE